MKTPFLSCLFLAVFSQTASSQPTPERPPVTEAMRVFTPEAAIWFPTKSPNPKGSRAAIIQGTNWPQGPSTILVSTPAGSRYPLMWHSNVEKMYVIQGEFYGLLEGDKEIRLTPGSNWYVPAGMIHGARCGGQEPCVHMEIRDKAFDQFFVEPLAKKE